LFGKFKERGNKLTAEEWQKLELIKNNDCKWRLGYNSNKKEAELEQAFLKERRKNYRNTYLSCFHRQDQKLYEKITPYKTNTYLNKSLKISYEKLKILEEKLNSNKIC
jgi:hypothetical protein